MNLTKWFVKKKKEDPMIKAQEASTRRKIAMADQSTMVLKSLFVNRRLNQEDYVGPERRALQA